MTEAQLPNFSVRSTRYEHVNAIFFNAMLQVLGDERTREQFEAERVIEYEINSDFSGRVYGISYDNHYSKFKHGLTKEELDSIAEYMRENYIFLPRCVWEHLPMDYEFYLSDTIRVLNDIPCRVEFPTYLSVYFGYDKNKMLNDSDGSVIRSYIRKFITYPSREILSGYQIKINQPDKVPETDSVASAVYDKHFLEAYDWISYEFDNEYQPIGIKGDYCIDVVLNGSRQDYSEYGDSVKQAGISGGRLIVLNDCRTRTDSMAAYMLTFGDRYYEKYKRWDFYPFMCAERVLEFLPDNRRALEMKLRALLEFRSHKSKEATYYKYKNDAKLEEEIVVIKQKLGIDHGQ